MPDIRQQTFDSEAMQRQARENLEHNREYNKLYKEFHRLDPRRDLVKRSLMQTKMRHMENQEFLRLQQLEMERRKNVNTMTALLQGEERNRYQELMSGLSLLLDLMDTTFSDVNMLLMRNNTGIQMDKFPELRAARKMLWEMANGEQEKMPQYKLDLWADESERLYKVLQERMGVFRRKVEREEARLAKKKED